MSKIELTDNDVKVIKYILIFLTISFSTYFIFGG